MSYDSLLKSLSVTILVVEDADETRQLIKSILEKNSYIVYTATNGQEAIEAARENKVDIVISDIEMPVMDGMKLFEELHAKQMPFIFLTSHQEILNSERAFEIGAAEYLRKPFSTEQLLTAVDRVTYQINSGFKDTDPEYLRLPISDFINGKYSGVDVFLRLSPTKYLKVAKSDGPIKAERLNSFQDKGLKFLYVKKLQIK